MREGCPIPTRIAAGPAPAFTLQEKEIDRPEPKPGPGEALVSGQRIPVRTDVKSPERFKLPAADEAMKRAIKIDYSKVMNEKEPTVKKFTDIMQKK